MLGAAGGTLTPGTERPVSVGEEAGAARARGWAGSACLANEARTGGVARPKKAGCHFSRRRAQPPFVYQKRPARAPWMDPSPSLSQAHVSKLAQSAGGRPPARNPPCAGARHAPAQRHFEGEPAPVWVSGLTPGPVQGWLLPWVRGLWLHAQHAGITSVWSAPEEQSTVRLLTKEQITMPVAVPALVMSPHASLSRLARLVPHPVALGLVGSGSPAMEHTAPTVSGLMLLMERKMPTA